MILILLRVSLPSKLSKTNKRTHIHSHTIIHAYIRTNAVLVVRYSKGIQRSGRGEKQKKLVV